MKRIGIALILFLATVSVALASWVQVVADCEDDENWTAKWESDGSTVSGDTLYHVEGEQGIRLTCTTRGRNMRGGTARLEFDPPRDFGRNPTEDDYVYLAYYLPNAACAIYLRYWTGDDDCYIGYVPGESIAGWHFVEKPRTKFVAFGSPDWGQIDAIELYITFLCNAEEHWIAFDNWRHVTITEEEYYHYLPILLF